MQGNSGRTGQAGQPGEPGYEGHKVRDWRVLWHDGSDWINPQWIEGNRTEWNNENMNNLTNEWKKKGINENLNDCVNNE